MNDFLKRLTVIGMALAIVFGSTGCGKSVEPESISITLNGEAVKSLEMLNGSEQSGLAAVVVPEDQAGEITWRSEDSGIVKVVVAEDGTCSLTAKKTGSAKIYAECGEASAFLQVRVEKDFDNLSLQDTAVVIADQRFSVEYCNIVFVNSYYDFVAYCGDSAAGYGLDITTGFANLKGQTCDYSNDGTWYGYFLENTKTQILQTQAMCDYAKDNGITLSEEKLAEIEKQIEDLKEPSEEKGFDTLDKYLASYYGDGVTTDLYRKFLTDTALAEKVYAQFSDSLTYTDEEIETHYSEMDYEEGENDYPLVTMRHILIEAEADESGQYSDAAIQAAHDKAAAILEEWKAGDRSEASFAELANQNSDDAASNTEGGLYENIYQGEMVSGLNDWLFAEGRQVGDTGLIDETTNYVGTHVVYLAGFGDLYRTYLSREDLKSTELNAWFSELCEGYSLEQGGEYSEIGMID